MRKLLSFLLITISCITMSMNASGNIYKQPDFAYPKQVSAKSAISLDMALLEADMQGVVRSAMDYELAQSSIDGDSISETIDKIRSVIADTRVDSTAKSLLTLYLADIYRGLYNSNRWVYDQRRIPPTPLPEDYHLWSGEQFCEVIKRHVEDAVDLAEATKTVPIGKYGNVIEIDKGSKEFYPSVYDFVAYKSISLLNGLSQEDMIFSIGLLTPYDVYIQEKFTYQSDIARDILQLYQSLLKLHKSEPAPFIMADIERIRFIADRIESDGPDFRFNENVTESDMKEAIEYLQGKSRKVYSMMMKLYESHRQNPCAAEALIAAGNLLYPQTDAKLLNEFITIARTQLKDAPGYFRNNCLSNKLAELTQPIVNVSTPSIVAPGDSLILKVSNYNTGKYVIKIYRTPQSGSGASYYQYKPSNPPTLVKTIPVTVDSKAPFFRETTERVVIDKPGRYIVVPEIEGVRNNFREFSQFMCTSLYIRTSTFGDSRWAGVVNPLTGAPVEGAVISAMKRDKVLNTYTTPKEGYLPVKDQNVDLHASKGSDRYAYPVYIGRQYGLNRELSYVVHPFTDLAIYHPGDTVQWSLVAQSYGGDKEAALAPGLALKVELMDANNQPVDSAETTTDSWGRAVGSLVIPKSGLTGNFMVQISTTAHKGSSGRRYCGAVRIMVSDYKLPTYYVEVSDILRGIPGKGDVTLKGRTVTYSGFPLADAQLSVDLQAAPRSWWWTPRQSRSFYSTKAVTDAEGRFSIELPDSLLKMSPIADGIFNVLIVATSATGESQSTWSSFTQGKQYQMQAGMTRDNTDISRPVSFDLSLENLSGKKVDAEIRYTVVGPDKQTVASGITSTGNKALDLSSVPSGQYTLKFEPADSSLADAIVLRHKVLYRPTDKLCPVKDAVLWVPKDSYTLSEGRRSSILYGVTAKENHVQYTVYTDSAILKRGWIKCAPGLHRFEYDLPQGTDRVKVTLAVMSGYKSEVSTVSVVVDESIKSLTLSIESFRDRIVPGNHETWTFKLTDHDGKGVSAPLMLDMYAKALDGLAPQTFGFGFLLNPGSNFWLSSGSHLWPSATQVSKEISLKHCSGIAMPQFQTWGMPIVNFQRNIYVRGMSRMKNFYAKAEATVEMEDAVDYETSNASGALLAEHKVVLTGSADESAEVTEEEPAEADGGESAETGSEDTFEYRAPETPLAFFRPMLTTGADGSLSFSFTAPNANTTWQLRALAYSDELLVASLAKEIISSKPIMVQPNLPRFLRNGDKACVQSAVMNNSDKEQTVVTTVEIFEPVSGKIIDTQRHTDTIPAGASAKVSTWIDAPAQANLIGYRVKSASETFADGEQALIPVLPSIEPVIETRPFYMQPDASEFSMKLPKMPKDARVTLQFCENPVWYVVTALPGIRKEMGDNALSASAAIFSAAVAEGILRTDPSIAEAIKMWNESDKNDSTLVSMLERNADLKTVLLNSTPWVMDAQSQTERMERLALLFDKNVIADTYAAATKKLSNLACDEGGWAWIEQYKEPSVWITENILAMMGHLKQLGYMPENADLTRMLNNAVGYYDSYITRQVREHPDFTSPLSVLIRGCYPERKMPVAVKNFVTNTIGTESRKWKERDLPMKAIDAIILNRNGYPTVAREILKSVREFAVTKPESGMWWPSFDKMTVWSMGKISATSIMLDAFTEVEPKSADIDLIRQWLILQKEAKDWGTSVVTTEAVASILLSGSKWTRPAQGIEVKIGDRRVAPNRVDSLLGYFRENVSDLNPSNAVLSISKQPGYPSWGAVYTQFSDKMDNIKAAKCADLSVDKTIYRRVVTENGISWETPDELKVGDLVQINLTITAKRDIDYVAVIDDRGACLEPVEQIPAPLYSEGICFYRENRDSATNIFVTHMPKGTYRLSYEMYVNNAGTFSSGIASVQSQYAPAISAHSAGGTLTVSE